MKNFDAFLIFTFCSSFLFASEAYSQSPRPLTVMSYNIENLFDTKHDEGKNDFTFTPTGTPGKEAHCESQYEEAIENCEKLSGDVKQSCTDRAEGRKEECYVDWNQDRYEEKLEQISKSILAFDDERPDFLALQEVENRGVVEDLVKQVGYKVIRSKKDQTMENVAITNSPDKRGIDVALVYKASKHIDQIGEAKEYAVDLKPIRYNATRNILKVKFKVFNKYKIYFFVVHLPSQGGGYKSNQARRLVALKLQDLIDEVKLENKQNHIVVLGDFNVLERDRPHAIYDVLYGKTGRTKLYDVFEGFQKNALIPREQKYILPLGTTFYPNNMSWSRFDRILVSDNLEAGYIKKCQRGLASLTESYGVHNSEFLLDDYTYEDWKKNPKALVNFHVGSMITNTPYRYSILPPEGGDQGYSDHFGVFMKLWESQTEPDSEECRGGKRFGYGR